MSASVPASHAVARIAERPVGMLAPSPAAARLLLLLLVLAGGAAGFLATGPEAVSAATANAGRELTHLLRAMAAMKTGFAIAGAAVTYWRLGSPVGRVRFVVYAVAVASMMAGPGLIWGMAQVKLGALLLHGGLLATILLLWRDPALSLRLSAMIAARRAKLA